MTDLIVIAAVLAAVGIPCAAAAVPERIRVSLAHAILGSTPLVANASVSAEGIGIFVPSSAISLHVRNVTIYNVAPRAAVYHSA